MEPRERAARDICAVLRGAGHRALFAGGCVRDHLLGAEVKDFDIATSARHGEVKQLFGHVLDIGAAFGVSMIVLPEGHFEVTTFRRDGPYTDGRHPDTVEFTEEREDALRRDFTVNALFMDPVDDAVLDYVGGRNDLRAGIIRAVGDPTTRFREDHLRLMRAVRFAARLGFAIEEETFAAIRALAPAIHTTSAERMRDELIKMLTEGDARAAFLLLDATGLLAEVLPEVAAMKGVEQPPEFHPEGDVFVHTLLLLAQLQHPPPTLALGALLHDVGKPVTQTFDDRIRFNLHDKVGARMAGKICQRLRMSNEVTERVVWLVEQHMRLAATPEMRESKRRRFVRETGFDELLQLGEMDCRASHGDTAHIDWIRAYRERLTPEQMRPAPLLNGHDLIALGYAPGAQFKEILTAVEDAQLEGVLQSRSDAVDFVRMHWKLAAAPGGQS